MSIEIEINSDDFWFKVVDFLQANWALIEKKNNKYVIYFLMSDYKTITKVFDQIAFETLEEAQKSLRFNGFQLYLEDKEFQKIEGTPVKPFIVGEHPNGKIYSSGKFWRNPIKFLDQAINAAIFKFKAGENINHYLEIINKDTDALTQWMYDNDFHLCNYDYLAHMSVNEVFLVEEKLHDYFQNPLIDLDFKDTAGIEVFINNRISHFDGHSAYQYCWINDVFISGRIESTGQSGHELHDFLISTNFKEFCNHFKEKNIIVWKMDDKEIISHKIDEMIYLFEKLVKSRLKDY